MNAIEETISRIENMIRMAPIIAVEEFKKEADLMAQLNRDQLMSGTDALGNSTPTYVSNSKAPQAPGKIKFFDKGDFQQGIKSLFSSEGIEMTSTDFKNKFLNPYKKVVETLGLSPRSVEEVQIVVLPRIINRLRKL